MSHWQAVYLQLRRFLFDKVGALLGFGVCFLIWNLIFGMANVYAANGVPKVLSYQGRLLDASGNLLGGSSGTNYCFRFSIYSAVSGGTKLWPSGTPSTMTVNAKNGIYNVGIGDTDNGGDSLTYDFEESDTTYLNIDVANSSSGSCTGVSSFETLTPRQRITASAYNINSATTRGVGLTSSSLPLTGSNPVIQSSSTNTLTVSSTRIILATASTTIRGVTYSWPTADGSSGTALVTNGSGTLSWSAVSPSIGGAITSATAGSILFASGTAILGQNNANLFWDNANNRLGVGTIQPSSTLHVLGSFQVSSTVFYVSSTTGNVGIGTTSPGAKLEVVGVASSTELRTPSATIATLGGVSTISTTGTSTFATSGGNVGIGTAAPSGLLHVAGNALIGTAGVTSFPSSVDVYIGAGTTGKVVRVEGSGSSIGVELASTNGGDIVIGSVSSLGGAVTAGAKIDTSSGVAFFGSTNSSDKITGARLEGSGGGGAFTSPSLLGNVNPDTGTVYGLTLFNRTFNLATIVKQAFSMMDAASNAEEYASIGAGIEDATAGSEDGFLRFDTLSAGIVGERIRITSTGNVGIGTTSPGAKLEVVGVASSTELRTPSATIATLSGISTISTTGTSTFAASGGNVGIGTTSPGSKLHLTSNTADDSSLFLEAAHATAGTAAAIVQRRARGTIASPSAVSSDDRLALFIGQGYGSTGYGTAGGLWIEADGTPSSNNIPGRLVFKTSTSSTSDQERMRITNGGNLLIGGTTTYNSFGQPIEVNTSANYGGIAMNTWTTTSGQSPLMTFNRSKSATVGTHSAVASGDYVGQIDFRGSDGTGFITVGSIQGNIDGTPGTNDMPGRLSFHTTLDGASSASERVRINNAGVVIINGTTDSSRLGEKLVVHANTSNFGGAAFTTWSATADNASILDFQRSRSNTEGTQTVVASADLLGYIVWRGSDGTDFEDSVSIRGTVDGTPGNNDMPGRLTFWTTPDGSNSSLERMRIDNAGNVGIGTTQPSSTLHVTGGARIASSTFVALTEGSFGVGTSTVGTGGNLTISIASGTAPTSYPANMAQLWAQTITGVTELRVADSAGNITTLSPHNYTLIPREQLEDDLLSWSFTSENSKKGYVINVDMYGIAQAVEALSGHQFIYAKKTSNEETVDRTKEIERVQKGSSLLARIETIEKKLGIDYDAPSGTISASNETTAAASASVLVSGVETRDRVTGEIYCIYIQYGIMTTARGKCDNSGTAQPAPALQTKDDSATATPTSSGALISPTVSATSTDQATSTSQTTSDHSATDQAALKKAEEVKEKSAETKPEETTKEKAEPAPSAEASQPSAASETPSVGNVTLPEASVAPAPTTENPSTSLSPAGRLFSLMRKAAANFAAAPTKRAKAVRTYIVGANVFESFGSGFDQLIEQFSWFLNDFKNYWLGK